MQKALSLGQSPFYTTYLFYPTGTSLITHNVAWLHILPWLLLEPMVGGILAYNIVLLIHLALCGCAAFALTYRLTGNAYAAFLAGLIYQAWPFRLSQLDHPNLLATLWIPLFFLFLMRTIREGRWRDSLFAALFFALVGYTRWQQLIPVTLMGLTYFGCTAPQWLPRNRRFILARLCLAGGIAVAALLPPLFLLLDQGEDEIGPLNLLYQDDELLMQTDVLAYITPSGWHPVLKKWTRPLYNRYYADRAYHRRYPAYIGIGALFLALAGIKSKRWESLPWVLMAILLISLAQGAALRLNGRLYRQIPTLYRLLSPLVFVRWIRVPDRFNMFLALPVSTLAAYGMAGVLARKRRTRQGFPLLLSGVLGVAILFEYTITPVPTRHHAAADTPFYAQIAQEPGDFAVLNIPFNTLETKGYMFEQTVHQRPIVAGHVSRRSGRPYIYVDENPWLHALRKWDEMPHTLNDVGRQLGTLAQDNIRYIIMHKEWIGTDRIAHWQRYLLIQPRYQDERVAIYVTTPEVGQDFALIGELVPGFGPIKVLSSASCLNPGRVLEVAAGWGSARALDRDFHVTLSLVDNAGITRHAEQFPLSTSWPTSQWPAHTITWEYYTLHLPPAIPVGEYAITFALQDSATGQSQGQPVSVQSVTLQSEICNLATVPEAKDVNAVFGDELRLTEYEILRREGRLDLDLYWRAERWMDIDYKVFVHVADPVTGIPVAQNDAMPHQGAYPTTFWWPGEVVRDRISISLHSIPSGRYDIAVGVYEPTTVERLPLVDHQGQAIADSRLLLQDTVEIK